MTQPPPAPALPASTSLKPSERFRLALALNMGKSITVTLSRAETIHMMRLMDILERIEEAHANARTTIEEAEAILITARRMVRQANWTLAAALVTAAPALPFLVLLWLGL